MQAKSPRKRTLWKWIISILLLLAIALVSVSWYLSVKLRPLIREEITALVKTTTHGLYDIEYSTIQTNLITGSATINDVKISPDTSVYQALVASKEAPNNLYYIKLNKLSVRGFHPLLIYFKQQVKIRLLLFAQPDVIMVNRHFDFNDNKPPRPQKSPYDYISKLFNSLQVEQIDFKDANFKYVNKNGAIPEIDSVHHFNVTLKDWLIDAHSAKDTTRIYLLKDIHIRVDHYNYATPDSMYRLKLDRLDFAVSSGKLNINQFSLEPRYSTADFAKVNGYARDRYQIMVNNISMEGIDLPAYIQKKELFAQQMQISDGEVTVYNDNRLPHRVEDKTGKFPHQLLQQLKAKLNIDSIGLKNINISYAEFDRESKQVGKITFEQTEGLILNVTNMAERKAVQPILSADLQSYVMGQGRLKVGFKFDLNSPKGSFSYEGALTNLDGRTLNRITKPLGMVQVNRGEIKKLAFAIQADETLAKGKLDFTYHDLSVALLKKEEGKDRLVRQGLISFLANNLIIYADNPNHEGKFTSAIIQYKRKTEGSFFNYIWRSLFQGVKYSVGITPQKEAEVREQLAKFEKMKADRDLRRQRRQLRKADRDKN